MKRSMSAPEWSEYLNSALAHFEKEGVAIPRRWRHGLPLAIGQDKGWRYSQDSGTFYIADFHQPPTYYCLGERMIHAEFGRDSYGILWVGSTSNGWHTHSFGYDLKDAIEFVRAADFKILGPYLWSKDPAVVKERPFRLTDA